MDYILLTILLVRNKKAHYHTSNIKQESNNELK